MWPAAGFILALAVWWLGITTLEVKTPIAAAFSPKKTGHAFIKMVTGRDIWQHVAVSLKRVGVGLTCAILVGVPLGILIAMSKPFSLASTPLFQFLWMVSPLSWMPLAVMVLDL